MVINNPLHFRLDTTDPAQELWNAICKFVKNEPKGLPAYREVATWLSDNNSRGLICVGTSSLGKSVICCQALPYLFKRHFDLDTKVVTATEMNQRIDELLQYCGQNRIIVIDDLGSEPVSVYGRRPFFELASKAETTGTLLIITTNLRTTKDTDTRRNYPSIETRYGIPALERLKAITKVIVFKGESLRK